MSASKICPQCNNEYPLDQRFCPLDGATLKAQGTADDLVGSVVADRYYVLRKLGEGGMGQVYLAEHVRMGRKSALKVMHPGMVHDADAISRFNREAANASRISHPNVAAIYDFGETGDGLIYLAMEFVEGDALTQVVERTGALPPLRAADIVRQTGDALAAAHDMGIVHRDLKPDNIMLTKNRDGSDCVKVVDFGIAKSNEGSQKVTKTGLVVGTPEYMSPEQLAGDKLDGRSDTYSLALVAFNVLTGKLPFPSESAQESMIMRLTDRPRRLSEMRAEVEWPEQLQAVMDRALERDAKLRYASAAEFGRDFARAIEAMPEAAEMTAGTQVMGATALIPPTLVASAESARSGDRGPGAGATEVVTPLQVPPSPVSGPPTAKAITGRTPMLAAAAVIVVLGLGAAGMKFFAGTPSDAGAQDPAAVSAPPSSEKTDVASAADSAREPAEQFGADLGQRVPDAGTVQPVGGSPNRPGGSPSTSGPGASPAGTSTPARGSAASIPSTLERAETLNDALDPGQARESIALLNTIGGVLVKGSEDHIWAQFLRAEAHAVLGQEQHVCTVLATIQARSDDATRQGRIDRLRQACP